jgi:hypothetical protein
MLQKKDRLSLPRQGCDKKGQQVYNPRRDGHLAMEGLNEMGWKIVVAAVIVLAAVVIGALYLGARRWKADVRDLRDEMDAAREPTLVGIYDPRKLDGLPEPVRRYFGAVLQEGQPVVASARFEHSGTFNMGETEEQWKRFTSMQHVVTRRPGFVWDARITMAPGMAADVRDAYVAGRGLLVGKLFGLVTVVEQQNTPEMAQGELLRVFAESAWYPTALLPDQGIVWEAIDDARATATLTDGDTTVRLEFEFDEQGLIHSIYAEARYRDVDGTPIATPWQGFFWEYARRDGMLIPLEGEVGWLIDGEYRPYWRGRIEQIEYEYVP